MATLLLWTAAAAMQAAGTSAKTRNRATVITQNYIFIHLTLSDDSLDAAALMNMNLDHFCFYQSFGQIYFAACRD